MEKPINLFCLTFAGGNKYSYRVFSGKTPPFLNIITLEYPGRGSRLKEQLASDIHHLVNDVYRRVKLIIDEGQEDYAIYGHSLGGLVGYLLTLKLLDNKQRPPEHLFITGTTGPSALSRQKKKRHSLPKVEFIQEIKDLGGMPDEILQNEDILDFLEPILRADFRLSETYAYKDHAPINIPLTVITGNEEDMKNEDILLWQKESNLNVDFMKMPGGHFFILQHIDRVLEIISNKLLNTQIINSI